jgi:multisubunit Na+/H+ antiporter MnhB subunit
LSTDTLLLFDALLLLALAGLAWAALAGADARRSVILFIAFGLLLAVAWARLQAPDVALAEAAIGAGLSGALLLAALRRQLRPAAGEHRDRQPGAGRFTALAHGTITLLCVALTGSLAWALLHALGNPPAETLPQTIAANLAASGVSNPVTAVLLNFRAYDTLLELAVLLTAVLGMQALGRASPGYRPAGPVFDGLVHWLVPVLIVTAAYLLWAGAHAPGGAFQAGATLAAAGVVLRLAGRSSIGLTGGLAQRTLLVAGIAVFLLVGLAQLALGRPFLAYPPAWAGTLILLIETAAMAAIAATLLLAFAGGRTPDAAPSPGGGTAPARGRATPEPPEC